MRRAAYACEGRPRRETGERVTRGRAWPVAWRRSARSVCEPRGGRSHGGRTSAACTSGRRASAKRRPSACPSAASWPGPASGARAGAYAAALGCLFACKTRTAEEFRRRDQAGHPGGRAADSGAGARPGGRARPAPSTAGEHGRQPRREPRERRPPRTAPPRRRGSRTGCCAPALAARGGRAQPGRRPCETLRATAVAPLRRPRRNPVAASCVSPVDGPHTGLKAILGRRIATMGFPEPDRGTRIAHEEPSCQTRPST